MFAGDMGKDLRLVAHRQVPAAAQRVTRFPSSTWPTSSPACASASRIPPRQDQGAAGALLPGGLLLLRPELQAGALRPVRDRPVHHRPDPPWLAEGQARPGLSRLSAAAGPDRPRRLGGAGQPPRLRQPSAGHRVGGRRRGVAESRRRSRELAAADRLRGRPRRVELVLLNKGRKEVEAFVRDTRVSRDVCLFIHDNILDDAKNKMNSTSGTIASSSTSRPRSGTAGSASTSIPTARSCGFPKDRHAVDRGVLTQLLRLRLGPADLQVILSSRAPGVTIAGFPLHSGPSC